MRLTTEACRQGPEHEEEGVEVAIVKNPDRRRCRDDALRMLQDE